MAGTFSPEQVADAFVKQYYLILKRSPENFHKLYQEWSIQGCPGPDGVIEHVSTLSDCSVEVKTTDFQESYGGGIVLFITGYMAGEGNLKKNFAQTFFLARQERGFYVLNDILRFLDVSSTNSAFSGDDGNDPPAPTQNSAPSDTSDSRASSDTNTSVENGESEEAVDASDQSGVVPEPNVKSQSAFWSKKLRVPADPKVPSVVTADLNVAFKVSYASMLAKENPATSPRAAAVPSNVQQQESASPTTKAAAAAPPANNPPKVSTPSGGTSKGSTSSSKVALNSPRGDQGAPSASPHLGARAVYIGGLPYDITKQGVVDVVKQFGPVRRFGDTVQIKRHEDGFCCAFVEFESADAAARAVEVHHVMFGEKEAYIAYKRSSRGNDGRARSPARRGGGQRNSNPRGPESDKGTYHGKGKARGSRQSSSSDQWLRQGGGSGSGSGSGGRD